MLAILVWLSDERESFNLRDFYSDAALMGVRCRHVPGVNPALQSKPAKGWTIGRSRPSFPRNSPKPVSKAKAIQSVNPSLLWRASGHCKSRTDTVKVTAYQFGDSQYAAATPVSQSFMVAPATLTVTAKNFSVIAGSVLPTPTFRHCSAFGQTCTWTANKAATHGLESTLLSPPPARQNVQQGALRCLEDLKVMSDRSGVRREAKQEFHAARLTGYGRWRSCRRRTCG
jgi:hypothetical protein